MTSHWMTESYPGDLWPLRYLIRVTKRQKDKKTKRQKDKKTKRHLRHWLQFWQLRTWVHDNFCYQTIKSDTRQNSQFLMFEKTMTFRKHPQRFTLETCDLCNIWSGWWGDMTLPKWTMTMTLAMTFREHPQSAMLQIFDLRLDTWDTDYISDNWE